MAKSWFIENAKVEAFVTHFRNLIVFLYPDEDNLLRDDVSAHHFLSGPDPYDRWIAVRPPLCATLRTAKTRADKETAHLTCKRVSDFQRTKDWHWVSLAAELRPVLQAFVAAADPSRLDSRVAEAIPTGSL